MVRHAVALLVLSVATAGCELTDATVVDFTDVLVAEVYVTVGAESGDSFIRAFLQGNVAGSSAGTASFDDASVVVDLDGVDRATLLISPRSDCLESAPEGSDGSCFVAPRIVADRLQPGMQVGLDVALADGRTLTGVTTIPGDFQLGGPGNCRLPSDTPMEITWSEAEGAWAYLSEASIFGLGSALEDEGIDGPDELYLLGLSIASSDTTVVFPGEFGVFDRLDLDRDLAVRLQRGLPAGTVSDVAISAVDRNFVNWIRGGNFNPSGQVRISSLSGDGAGVIASAVVRRFSVVGSDGPTSVPTCEGI